ncbi:MAG: hypothetical protein RR203_02530 [Synergistaceae bacterium]
MKITHNPSNEEIRKRRQEDYLALWPIDKQLEAHAEASMGRQEKLNKMMGDFEQIRSKLPFFYNSDEEV